MTRGNRASLPRARFALWTALGVFAVAIAGGGCSGSGGGSHGSRHDGPKGSRSLFVDGCPKAGRATARSIGRPDLGVWGPGALGKGGDFLLMNDRAAFAVTGPDEVEAYYYYGGILVDAVALEGCRQAGPERYGELEVLVGELDLGDFTKSNLHGFRAESVEVLSDGSDGGPAIVRARGRDDFYWLVEYDLIRRAFESGSPRHLSEPFGLEMTVDYILPPDSSVLRVEVGYKNSTGDARSVIPMVAHIFGATLDVDPFELTHFSAAGFGLEVGAPWLTATSPAGDGAVGFAIENAVTTRTNVSGVDAAFNLLNGVAPLKLSRAGRPGDAASARYFVSVGATDGSSAERPLRDARPEIYPGVPYELVPVGGTTLESATGAPIVAAEIVVEAQDADGAWRPLHRFRSDERGAFGGAVARFGGGALEYRVVAHAAGRHDPDPILIHPTSGLPPLEIRFDSGGALAYDIRDDAGRALPARISLWQNGRNVHTIREAKGSGREPVRPGRYDVSVTRGFEYTTFQGSIDVTPNAPATLAATLTRVVDTTGWLSMDGHLHAAPSADSPVTVPDRIVTCAAEGLEVPISTDHEFIDSWQSGIDETGLGDWVATIPGEELTATVPEHTGLYAVEPRLDIDGRGGPVEWYEHDIDELYAAARERGAGLVQLNHPRGGCNWMCLIRYDRLTGEPALIDPTELGLKPGAKLWSWNFDLFEYMNGVGSPFVNPAHPEDTGLFEDWMSFLNLGQRKTAVGVTDTHGLDRPGSPLTYFASSTDEPRNVDVGEFVRSMREGRALVSAGAFARVQANGSAGPGDLITDTDGTVRLSVHIEAIPEIDVTHFIVFANCDEVAKVANADPAGVVKYEGTIDVPVQADANIVVLGFGRKPMPRGLEDYDSAQVPRFTTNAIYVDADGNGRYDPPGGKICRYSLDPPA